MFPNAAYGQFLKASGEQPVTWKRAASMDEVLREADLVRLFLSENNTHFISLELDFFFFFFPFLL